MTNAATGHFATFRTRLLATLTTLFLVIASPAVSAERVPSEQATQLVRGLVDEALAGNAVGLSVALAYDGDIVLEEGYGSIELEHDVVADAESMFRIGSITKQFTAALVMKRVEDGDIGLDDEIGKYVDFPTQGKKVTVRHLLTHTSGIKSYTGLGPTWLKTVPLEMTHEELLDLVDDLPFDFDPGIEYRYNNSGYYLLGVILEKVSGRSFEQLLAEEIAAPLELTRTRYGSNGDIIRNRAQGYTLRDGEIANDDLIGMSQPGAAGAMLSTAGDLLRWQRALRAGQVVSAESYQQMTTPHVLDDGESVPYGFGLAVDESDGLRRVQHGGGINGFNSMLAYFPDTGVGVAVISNSEGFRAGTLARDIARAVHQIEVRVSDLPVTPAEQERLVGSYAFDMLPLEMVVSARGDHLFIEATGQAEDRLLHQGEARFRASFDNEVRVEFADGAPAPSLTLYQGGGSFVAQRKDE